ncbi:MAG TPA: SPFH domain-containing protein [Chitinophagales bacterium]|nr:SPFH domain-containing protein [Chitinophagales bacterium]
MDSFFILLAIGGFMIFSVLSYLISRYKRCPSDKILVIYGKTGKNQASRCIHGGAAFIVPVIQDYAFLDLNPLSIDVDLKSALSKQNIRVDVPSRFTVGVSKEPGVMENAADRLLRLTMDSIRALAHDIIVGQMRLVIATMQIEEINADRDKFVAYVFSNVGTELKKIGLDLINVNVTDIKDESGYIMALGKEAAAQAINEAKKIVAEKNRDGAIGEANAKQEERIKVAEAESKAKVGEAEANAEMIKGQNLTKIAIASSEAERREREAEAQRRATAAEKVQTALALESAYAAQQKAEMARIELEKATRTANEIVQAEIEKQKVEIEAEAHAEKTRREAMGEADAILAKKRAEALGLYEMLSKQADGLSKIVEAAGGNSNNAVLLMIADKLPELVKIQVEAIKNIKIDKVTVWDSGSADGNDGNATSKFVSGLYKTIPPLQDLFKMAGMNLPTYLGEEANDAQTLLSKQPDDKKAD